MSLKTRLLSFFRENQNSLWTICGVISGLLVGLLTKFILSQNGIDQIDPTIHRFISLPGAIYIRVCMMLIAPLLLCSLATSLINGENVDESSHDENNRKEESNFLFTSILFFIGFTGISAAIGIGTMALVKPGSILEMQLNTSSANVVDDPTIIRRNSIQNHIFQVDSMINLVLHIFPDNLVSPLFAMQYIQTDIIWPPSENMSLILNKDYQPKLQSQTENVFKTNMIGISAISFALGLLMKQLGPSRTKTIRSLLFELNNLIGASFDALLQAMPVGMFCFMYSEALKMHSITNVAIQLGYFFSTVILCFTILLTIFYPTIMWLLSGQNCFRLYGNIIPAALVAIGTTSSAITLPMTMKCMEERERLSKRFTTTILPMGVTLNMNGTAMFYPMVAMFVAQMKSFDVGFAQMIVLTLFTIAMSMGFSGSPSTGNSIVNHIAFAAAIGIDNPEDILAFILPFEWIWSRVRTAINITGDCVIAKCIEGISNRNAKKISKMTNN